MTICRKCGTSNKDNQKYCSFCHELLVADPVELAKLEAAQKKKQEKEEKKLKNKHFRWKFSPLLLIPIGLMDLVNLILCLDVLFLGIGEKIGSSIASTVVASVGETMMLFGNLVYTADFVIYLVRGIELLGAVGFLVLPTILAVIMIVNMVKWSKHKRQADAEKAKAEKENAEQQEKDKPRRAQVDRAAIGDFAVSYDELAAIASKHAEYIMPAPVATTDCKELFKAMHPYMWEYDDDSIRRILSAMASSRLLVCSAGAIDSAGIFDSLTHALDTKAELHICADLPEEEDNEFIEKKKTDDSLAQLLLQWDEDGNKYTHSSFTKALYSAAYSPTNICVAGVRGISAPNLNRALKPLGEYFKLPDEDIELYLGKPAMAAGEQKVSFPERIVAGSMLLPHNVWMLSILPDDKHMPDVGGEIGRYCAAIYLRNSQNLFPPEEFEDERNTLPSVTALENAVAAAEQIYSLPEDLWRVLDQLEEQMVDDCSVHFSNRTIRMFERYTSVYMACGGKQGEAFDNGFAAIIIPAYVEQLRVLANRDEGERLSMMLDRMIGRDRLPMTVEVLNSLNLM